MAMTQERSPSLVEVYNLLSNRLGHSPIIGLDLDGTTADMTSGLRKSVISTWGLPVEENEEKRILPEPDQYAYYQGSKAWFKDKEEFFELFHIAEQGGMYRDLPIFQGAHLTLKELHSVGFNIKAVTARYHHYNEDTRHWVDKHELPLQEIIHSGVNKHLITEIDIFIDDAPHVISELKDKGRNVIIYDQLYNRDIEGVRIEKWDSAEITKAISQLL